MQPVYLPWLGYFEQMAVCDEFMILDDVQFTVRDWRNRNRIRTKNGWMWLTIPIKRAKLNQNLQNTEINFQTNWVVKHLKSIKTNYEPTPYFKDLFPIIEAAFNKRPTRLIDLTILLTLDLAEYMKISTKITYSSKISKHKFDKNSRVVELCHARSADVFYTGPAAKSYIDLNYFNRKGIAVIFQNYQHPEYKQCFNGFESHMSIIDLLMNHGPKSREILLSSSNLDKLRQ